ncbi:GspH/FimT family pseudopilin [uncultured Thiocystis sp.]|jgi:general secretion pathway protein H|uniref:GspH/FimT family pseudopilin n=1 Tax=uncultured Thiocystis sp. TaxID=1202134 RepID=UPI0025E11109|nr:GspH/FimT family pseudopilin [uncultured Thiocystis sp.]
MLITRPAIAFSRTRHAGFTLVELLVVLAIAALMMTAVPSLFSASFPGLEMKSAARRTAATLRLARESAIRRGTDTELLIDVDAHRLDLQGYRSFRFPTRLTIQLETASREMLDDRRGVIRFFPDGSSTGGRIIVENQGHGYQIGVIWLTGRIELAPWEAP